MKSFPYATLEEPLATKQADVRVMRMLELLPFFCPLKTCVFAHIHKR